jgi:hypothetical protein
MRNSRIVDGQTIHAKRQKSGASVRQRGHYNGRMADQTRQRDQTEAMCWQCGASASAECAYRFVLVAGSSRGLDPLGSPVERGAGLDKVRVRVPRCVNCRSRNRLSVMICFGGAAAGVIVFQQLGHEGVSGTTTWVAAVTGFVVALLGVALHRRLSGFRSLNSYPQVVTLRQTGWHYPS